MRTADAMIDLLYRVASGDRAAFASLYEVSAPKLYGIVLRILKRRAISDEILQEVYVKIWEKADDYDASRGSPIAWMAAIARNRALDEVRRKALHFAEENPETMEFADDTPSALTLVVKDEDCRRLVDCLSSLDSDRRQMVVLAYCEGLSRDAIAERYHQPVNTIKTWLRRSLKQLRGCLSQ